MGASRYACIRDCERKVDIAALRVFVLFTTVSATTMALTTASNLARDLQASVCLLAVSIVPYPLPLDQPAISPQMLIRTLVSTVAGACSSETLIHICYARQHVETWLNLLPPNSLVVVGSARRFWRKQQQKRWIKQLNSAGHHVILSDIKSHPLL